MLGQLAQQFLGGEAQNLEGPELHGRVGQMAQAAPDESVTSAVREALGTLGPQGFGQSVEHAAQSGGPQQHNALADTLLRAVSEGGGSQGNVLSQLGIGGQSMGAGGLASLATHVAENHPDALAGVLGSRLNNSGGGSGGVLQLLGNPMVRQIGMQLAGKVL